MIESRSVEVPTSSRTLWNLSGSERERVEERAGPVSWTKESAPDDKIRDLEDRLREVDVT